MKKVLNVFIGIFLCLTLVACGETCEHVNTSVSYEKGDLLNVVKITTCKDCEEVLEEKDLTSVEYVYNKEVLNSNGIKVTIDNLTIDGWEFVTLNFTVEGTSGKARTFETTQIYVNDVDTSAWVYVDELSNNKKSKQTHYIYEESSADDFFRNQDYEVEIIYSISTSIFDTLETDTISFNLNEFTSIKDHE